MHQASKKKLVLELHRGTDRRSKKKVASQAKSPKNMSGNLEDPSLIDHSRPSPAMSTNTQEDGQTAGTLILSWPRMLD